LVLSMNSVTENITIRPRILGVDIDAKGYRLYGDKIISSLITILSLLCRNP
jgi:hypothetical protein